MEVKKANEGQRGNAIDEKSMYCTYCGKQIAEDDIYCPHCGNKQDVRKAENESKQKISGTCFHNRQQ